MTAQEYELPPEIVEIHSHIGLFNPIEAGISWSKNQPRGPGFFAISASSFAFTTLSKMIYLTDYGMSRMRRALANGRDYEEALDSCYYVGALGEEDIPHLCTVDFFPIDLISKVQIEVHDSYTQLHFIFSGEKIFIGSHKPKFYDMLQIIKDK